LVRGPFPPSAPITGIENSLGVQPGTPIGGPTGTKWHG
jgi:hypothetical protein